MTTTVADLIAKLQELPDEWLVQATKSGRSLRAWDDSGSRYAYVFTDDQPNSLMVNRYREQNS